MRPALVWLAAALLLLPLLPLIPWAFARGWFFPDLLPSRWSLAAWDYALSPAGGLLPALGVTTLIAALAATVSLALALPAARALGQRSFPGKGAMMLLVLAPVLVPGLAVTMGLQGLMTRAELTGTLAGVTLVHLIPVLPYATLLLAALFSGLDPDEEAQARSLGASPAAAFARVTLPALSPGLAAAWALGFLVSWSQYAPTLVAGAGQVQTLPLLLFAFLSSGRHDIAGAIGLVYLVPGLLVLALASRTLGRGLGASR
ncbi:ABC transporter permease [Pseudoroseicyclus tamaricis]|uniref:ABC transporter permease subunit n=1 Tax=Pseudoroseicyclus tamaricis TaxID=2705421 RepID=A0A6B2K0B0_9RHOB|nr:ABC transporter permease subunit [Pseudoroseicyclus tamaricis]NDV02379.1 ABC transporter permease subunit [Pseudoroseicyclus tamaricis]